MVYRNEQNLSEIIGTTVLHTAAALGNAPATKTLLHGGAWPLYRCKSTGSTPLHLAASTGSQETLSILLKSVPPDHVDIQDNVSLINGASLSTVQSSLRTNDFIASQINRTPLHRASYQGHRECVRVLIDHGGNLAAETKSGVTVVDAIFAHIPRPVAFLDDILSSRVKTNSASANSHVSRPNAIYPVSDT